jgi:hypothetical protein
MAISVVHTATGTFSGSLSATATINGVTAGNMLIVVISHEDSGGGVSFFNISDGGGTYTQDYWAASSGGGAVSIAGAHRKAATSTNYTVTVTARTGTAANSNGAIALLEVSGLSDACFEQYAATGGQSTGPDSSGATSTLSMSNSLVVAALSTIQGFTGLTFPPTGGPGTFTSLISSSGQFADLDYQVISGSTSAVTTTWGTASGSGKWTAGCAIYRGAGYTGPGVVQASPVAVFNQSNPSTAVATLNNVTNGNAILVMLEHYDNAGGAPSVTISDGTSYNADSYVAGNATTCGVFSRLGVSSGNYTITATCSSDTAQSYGTIMAVEVQGITQFDKGSTGTGNNTTPATGTTGTLASANCIYLASLALAANIRTGGFTTPPTGGIGLYNGLYTADNISGQSNSADFEYQTQAAGTTGVSASWGTGASAKWSAVIAVYKPVSAATVFPFRRKGRIFVPVTYSR